ncbi:hypothetical protein [Streptomyces sp. NPDC001970]
MAAFLGLQVLFGVFAESGLHFIGAGMGAVLMSIAAGPMWAAQRSARAG